MAWISYYIRRARALVAVLACIHARWGETRTPGIHGIIPATLHCCMASRVRRCTAATGE